MGDNDEAVEFYSTNIDLSWLKHLPPSFIHDLLVSADRDLVVEDIPMLIEKYGAVAEQIGNRVQLLGWRSATLSDA